MISPQQLIISFFIVFNRYVAFRLAVVNCTPKHGPHYPPENRLMFENFLNGALHNVWNHHGNHEEQCSVVCPQITNALIKDFNISLGAKL